MAAEVATAYVSLIPSFKGGQGTIAKELGGAGKSGGVAASKGFKGSFLSGLKGVAAPMAGLLGVTAGISFLKDANGEAREAQKIGALTTATIKATGGAAKVTAKQVGDLAGAISAKTGIDDETIQSGQNMLLTFKNIRNEAGKGNDIFDQSTKALIDMSSAMGTEPKQAAIQLGKALNDPIKGATALGRAGVQFTDVQKGQIKQMVRAGDMMGAQKLILGELSSQFGGAAEAQATAGDKMAVSFGNLKEQIGTALLPVIDRFATFATEKVIPAVSKFIEQMQNGKGAGGKFVDALQSIKGAFQDVWDAVQPVVDFIVNNKAAVGTFAGALLSVAAGVKVWAVAQAILNVALAANPVGLVVVAVAALAAGFVYIYKKSETFRLGVQALAKGFLFLAEWGVRGFNLLLDAAFKVFDGILSAAETGLGWIPGLGGKISAARDAFQRFGDATTDKLDAVADKLRDVRDGIGDIPAKKSVAVDVQFTSRGVNTLKLLGDSYGGARAAGGPVSPSKYYLVGERGPELFVPKSAGSIVPNSGTRELAGSGYSPQGQAFRGVLSIDRDGVAYIDGVARSAVHDGAAAMASRRREAALDGL